MADLLREAEIAATALESIAFVVRDEGIVAPENCEIIAGRLRAALAAVPKGEK